AGERYALRRRGTRIRERALAGASQQSLEDLAQRGDHRLRVGVNQASGKIDVLEVVRLKRELLRRITVPYRSGPCIAREVIAVRGIRERRGARRVGRSVENYAQVHGLPCGKRIAEVRVLPGSVSLVIVQKLVVTEAGTRQQLKVEADTIGIERRFPILKDDGIGPLVNRRERWPLVHVARVA